MPSVSKKQHNLMALVANNPKAAKRLGIPQSVGKEFLTADKGKKFSKGGEMRNTSRMNKLEELGRVNAEKAYTSKGKKNLVSEKKRVIGELNEEYCGGGKVKKMAAGGMPVNPRAAAMMKKRAMMGARPDQMQNRPTMGRPIGPASAPAPTMPMKKGGKTMARMPSKGEHPVQKKAKRGAEIVKMAKGGSVKASAMGHVTAGGKRPHGEHTVQQKGHTRGTMVKMAMGGKTKKYC
jgi:hypothetical protein